MKFYIATICLVGSIMTTGCAELMGAPAAPPTTATTLSSADLLPLAHPPPMMIDENPYGPVEPLELSPMVAEDPWAPDAPAAPPAKTWGTSASMADEYGF